MLAICQQWIFLQYETFLFLTFSSGFKITMNASGILKEKGIPFPPFPLAEK
jgi:hypothetical protein